MIRILPDITPVIQPQAARSAVQVGLRGFSIDLSHHRQHQHQLREPIEGRRPIAELQYHDYDEPHAITIITVSYTHLTLPTIYSV